jgi:O-acetyl-ADP-ribose deacetylase (regulator of RNase III)
MNEIIRENILSSRVKFQLIHGDITEEKVDVIVNAANSRLLHGGGLAGLIARKGGSVIQDESNEWVRKHGPVSHSDPAYTSGGNLPFKYIIHAVGPVWGSGNESIKLADAITGSLITADTLEVKSISLPAISTGIFGFPLEKAAGIIIRAIVQYFSNKTISGIESVHLVLYGKSDVDMFINVWDTINQS